MFPHSCTGLEVGLLESSSIDSRAIHQLETHGVEPFIFRSCLDLVHQLLQSMKNDLVIRILETVDLADPKMVAGQRDGLVTSSMCRFMRTYAAQNRSGSIFEEAHDMDESTPQAFPAVRPSREVSTEGFQVTGIQFQMI